MAKYISALQRIEAMFQSAIEISKKYEIIMVTSNENHTDNTNDYSDNSVNEQNSNPLFPDLCVSFFPN